MEDYLIGRRSYGKIGNVTVGATAVRLLAANPKRTAVILFPPSAGRVTIGDGGGATIDLGPTIAAGSDPVYLDVRQVGVIVQSEIWAVADAGGRQVGMIETFLEDIRES